MLTIALFIARDEDRGYGMETARRPSRCGKTHASTLGVALRILFVCTGNICRSPMAERLAIAYADRMGSVGLTVSSAGTRAVVSHPIHDLAAQVLSELGGNASGFAARQLTPKVASSADVVITMTRAHRDRVLELAPRQLKKTFTLAEAAQLCGSFNPQSVAELASLRPQLRPSQAPDIPDPIGEGPVVFANVGQQIADLLPPILELCRISSAS